MTQRDVVYVEESWSQVRHEMYTEEGGLSANQLIIVKLWAVAQDNYLAGIKIHSKWHGYPRHVITVLNR